jgi:PTS system mannose-specific IIA component
MIGLVLVTHGKLAEEFRHALEHVVGPQTALETVSIGPEDDMDQRRLDIVGAVSRVENGHGVIILTTFPHKDIWPISAARNSTSPKPKCRA